MIKYRANVTEEDDSKVRTIKLQEGMIWTIVDVGIFGYYDDLIYRMLRIVDEYGNVEYIKSKQNFTTEEFNNYIKGKI